MGNLTEINCKMIFRNAYENRYTWNNFFRGYKGTCIFSINKDIHKGNFVLGKDYKPVIQKIDDDSIVKSIASQLFEVSIHRVKRDFDSIHSKNDFDLLDISPDGVKMKVSGKNEGDKYRVKDNCINMVYRKIHGTIIEIFVQEFLYAGTGFLSSKYTSQQINPVTSNPNSPKLNFEDEFINIDKNKNMWLLSSRTICYSNKNQKEEIQKFIFEDLSLL